MRFGLYFCLASDFLHYDMPKKFLGKVLRVIDTKTEECLYLMDEPHADLLHICLKNEKIHFAKYRLSVNSFELNPETEEAEQDKCKECLFDMEIDIQNTVDEIVTEFSLYEDGNGRMLYEEHWGAFPVKEFEALKEYAFQLQENAEDNDDLFCTTFLHEGSEQKKYEKNSGIPADRQSRVSAVGGADHGYIRKRNDHIRDHGEDD
ncbi:MAG: hypothetical protein K2N46_02570 [Lachnospiraceae bacterium]|nr:hypothetical protein [Lachnospiraceae bacterium]